MNEPCIEFEGRRLAKGYGYFGGKLAHRDAWEKANGPIPKGMWILHSCDNPPCINLSRNSSTLYRNGRHVAINQVRL